MIRTRETVIGISKRSIVLLALIACPCILLAQAQTDQGSAMTVLARREATGSSTAAVKAAPPAENIRADSAPSRTLYLKVQVPDLKSGRKIKAGQKLEGTLAQDVYLGNQEVLPSASRIDLTVNGFQRCRRPPTNYLPGVAALFVPRYKKCPTFESGRVLLAGGQEIPLRLSVISIAREKHVAAHVRSKHSSAPEMSAGQGASTIPSVPASQLPREARAAKHAGMIVTFEATGARDLDGAHLAAGEMPPPGGPSRPQIIPSGTAAKVVLLDSLSASKNHPGDVFHARLVEPVQNGTEVVLPEGSVLEGTVAKVARPRIPSRSGSLMLNFNRLILPDGSPATLSASLTGAELDKSSEDYIDAEGGVHGTRPGTLWMVINLGTTAGMAKLADDGTQLLIQMLVSTATDASTAGTARIVSTCVSGLFLLTRHGRDVVLPRFTEMDIAFNHPFSLSVPEAELLGNTSPTR